MKRHLLIGLGTLVLAGCSTANTATSTTTVPVTSTTSASTTTTSTSTTTTSTSTTSTTSSTTAPATTVPSVVIPEGVPPNDQLIEIVNTWAHRIWEISANPAAADVNYICLADSDCFDDYGAQIDDAKARGVHVEGAEPPTVNFIRFAEPTGMGDGTFMVSVWTNPIVAGTEVSPNGTRDERTSSPEGVGITLVFAPFPDDAAFPWRATQFIPDPPK